jgi:hypothetical protein
MLPCRWVKALFRKAAALQGLGQAGAAAAAAQQALLLEPDNREVRALLQQLGPAAAAAQGAAAAAGADAPSKPAPRAALLPPLLAGAPWEYAPAADGVDENLLLLLHGLGDRPAAFARLARQMALPQVRGVPPAAAKESSGSASRRRCRAGCCLASRCLLASPGLRWPAHAALASLAPLRSGAPAPTTPAPPLPCPPLPDSAAAADSGAGAGWPPGGPIQ